MTAILRYDLACQAVAEAKTIDEVAEWIDKAAAVREYGRRIKDRRLELDAVEIRIRAKKRRGELLCLLKERGLLKEGRKKLSPIDDNLSLADLDITPNESSEEQKIAAIDGNSFERLVARCRAYAEANPKLHTFNVLKPPTEGAVNGARAIMGSRHEPNDSLDYFPTPPWATRALIDYVLRPVEPLGIVWEPACGEGHIAEVLAEYTADVLASDIFDYGYGMPNVDFLTAELPGWLASSGADWIITNPPFGDKAEAFVIRAIERARKGVAMFFRLQWLESAGRYERIFAPYPPTVIAQFAERVPLHKGRWEPDGTTATAYLWIVWDKSIKSDFTKFVWITPGCRERLTFADDIRRFTAHPVIKNEIDPTTGEIIETPQAAAPGSPVVNQTRNAAAIVP